MIRTTVPLAAPYEVLVGRDLGAEAAAVLARRGWAARWFAVTDANVAPLHLAPLRASLRDAGIACEDIVLAAGERHKTLAAAHDLAAALIERGGDRTSGIIALGGGVVGDLAGFVASIYMRGIPVVQMPTTLLAQVDAAIGGKTAVDVPAGKNLLGTFHQPRAVFADLAWLDTLSDGDWRGGLAEIIKYGVIAEPWLLAEVGVDLRADADRLARVVAAAGGIKARIVAADEREGGSRRILNFGHTIGHAVEAASGYAVSHGEAVAMGMVAAARLSTRLGHLDAKISAAIEAAIAGARLPTRIPADLPVAAILVQLTRDKKKAGDELRFVLVRALGDPFVASVPLEVAAGVIEEVGA